MKKRRYRNRPALYDVTALGVRRRPTAYVSLDDATNAALELARQHATRVVVYGVHPDGTISVVRSYPPPGDTDTGPIAA